MVEEDKAIEQILTALTEGQPEYQACQAGGIKYPTWWEWKQRFAGLQERVDLARRARMPLLEDSIYKAAMKGDWRAAVVYLEKHDKGWRDRLKDSAGGTVVVDGTAAMILSMMPQDKRQKFLGALGVAGLLPQPVIEAGPSMNGHSNGNGNGSAH